MITNWRMYIQRISLDLANGTFVPYKPFYTNRMYKFNCQLHYRGHWRKQHERRKNYINSHIQMQIAVNISIDLVNLFVWHKLARSNATRFCKLGDCSKWRSNKLYQLIQLALNTAWKEAHFINTHVQWHLQQASENCSLGLSKHISAVYMY